MLGEVLSRLKVPYQSKVQTGCSFVGKLLQGLQEGKLGFPETALEAIFTPQLDFMVRQGQEKLAVVQSVFLGLTEDRFQLAPHMVEIKGLEVVMKHDLGGDIHDTPPRSP
jgi:hypothetical protein